jgi:hypothetical protein
MIYGLQPLHPALHCSANPPDSPAQRHLHRVKGLFNYRGTGRRTDTKGPWTRARTRVG